MENARNVTRDISDIVKKCGVDLYIVSQDLHYRNGTVHTEPMYRRAEVVKVNDYLRMFRLYSEDRLYVNEGA